MNAKRGNMKRTLFILILVGYIGHTQDMDKDQWKSIKKATDLTWEGNKDLDSNDFINAEANYRKAISENAENSIAPYNLGNAYYENETYSEAFGRFKQAAEKATEKADKHRAFHNMGNVFMKNKEYDKAVEAYKEALRNDPTDEETRYNFALAKEMLEKQKEDEKNNPDKDDQNKEDKNEDQNQNQDKEDGDQNEEDKGDQKEEQGDQGDENKEEDQEGEGDNKKEKEERSGKEDPSEQQPRPNQLSPQQVKNLLEAMQNEEKKVQEKIDAQNVRGVKVKNEKDW